MKVMVATRESQGERAHDLWLRCVEGEIVRPIEERCVAHDGFCSCETAFVGLASAGLTTTARVVDLPGLTRRSFATMVGRSLTPRERTFVTVARYAAELHRVAVAFRRTGVIERWDEWIGLRFDDDGALQPDITSIAAVDPAELDDIG